MKKLISLILCAAALVSMCACGGGGAVTESGAKQERSSAEEKITASDAAEAVLAPTAVSAPLPDGMAYAVAQCRAGDRVWLGGLGDDGGAMLGRVELPGGDSSAQPVADAGFVYAMCETADGLTVLCGDKQFYYVAPDGSTKVSEGQTGALALVGFDVDGNETTRTVLAENYAEDGTIFSLVACGDGYVMQAQRTLIKIAADGTELARAQLAAESNMFYFAGMAMLGDGLVAAVGNFEGLSGELRLFDPETLSESAVITLNDPLLGMRATESGLALCTERGIALLAAADEESASALTWDEVYLDSRWDGAEEYGEGFLLFSRYERELTYTRMTEQTPRTRLSLATDSAFGCVQTLVSEFNRSQNDYFIEVSVYNEDGDPGAGDRLRTEIGAGGAPDIYAFYRADTLGDVDGESLFADLLPMLDADGEYGRETIVPALLSAMQDGGSLRFLPYRFSIATMLAPQQLLPEPNASLEEMNAALASLGGDYTLLQNWVSSHQLLLWVSSFAVGKYVDFDAGACAFYSDDFVKLLEMCGQCPREEQFSGEVFTGVPNEDYLLSYELLQSMLRLNTLSTGEYWHGDFCFAGFPSDDGCGSYFIPEARLAISAASANTEGAWEFLRFSMSEEAQNADGYAFPSAQTVLEAQINSAVGSGELEEGGAEKFWELLDSTTFAETSCGAVLTIIENEAEAYFAGDCTAEDAAARIQSKVSIYLSERA